jgi:hypothetical protein
VRHITDVTSKKYIPPPGYDVHRKLRQLWVRGKITESGFQRRLRLAHLRFDYRRRVAVALVEFANTLQAGSVDINGEKERVNRRLVRLARLYRQQKPHRVSEDFRCVENEARVSWTRFPWLKWF